MDLIHKQHYNANAPYYVLSIVIHIFLTENYSNIRETVLIFNLSLNNYFIDTTTFIFHSMSV